MKSVCQKISHCTSTNLIDANCIYFWVTLSTSAVGNPWRPHGAHGLNGRKCEWHLIHAVVSGHSVVLKDLHWQVHQSAYKHIFGSRMYSNWHSPMSSLSTCSDLKIINSICLLYSPDTQITHSMIPLILSSMNPTFRYKQIIFFQNQKKTILSDDCWNHWLQASSERRLQTLLHQCQTVLKCVIATTDIW